MAWAARRLSPDGAAAAADRRFRLHDAIASYLHFSRSGRRDGYYALQADSTRQRVAPLDPQSIGYEPPRRGIALAVCLLAVAVPLGMHGPSERVLQQQQLAAATNEATLAINDELAKLVEELRQSTPDADEEELLDVNKLREWVEALQQTPDHKEALRQYAKLERKLNEARLALRNQRDEQLLEQAARELERSRETQPLADALEHKNYDRAAEQLDRMRPKSDDPSTKRQRQELARLKAAAQHMAAAARAARSSAANTASSASASRSASQSKSAGGKSSGASGSAAGASGAAGGGGGEMADTMQSLDQAVSDLDRALEEAERQMAQRGQCDAKQLDQCQSCRQCVSSQLSSLCKQLKRLGMCQRTDQRLGKLCKACSQCQGGLCSLCQGTKPGGKKAGWGSNIARRSQLDELLDNGQTTQLRGTKSQGPSQTTVESANEGSGVATRRATARQRTFQRQVESFVSREEHPRGSEAGRERILRSHSPDRTGTDSPGGHARCRYRKLKPGNPSSDL